MSTISKIDPTVRIRKLMRRMLMTDIAKWTFRLRSQPFSQERVKLEAFGTFAVERLRRVIRSSRLTGREKDVVARLVARRFSAMAAPKAEA